MHGEKTIESLIFAGIFFPLAIGAGWIGWWVVNFWRGIFGFVPLTIGALELAAAAVFVAVVFSEKVWETPKNR